MQMWLSAAYHYQQASQPLELPVPFWVAYTMVYCETGKHVVSRRSRILSKLRFARASAGRGLLWGKPS